jgi:hypothetical protein
LSAAFGDGLLAGLAADFAAGLVDLPTAAFFAAFLVAAVFFVLFVFVGISSLYRLAALPVECCAQGHLRSYQQRDQLPCVTASFMALRNSSAL